MATGAKTGVAVPAHEAGHRLAFFRQSGWMMFATVAAGALMYACHIPASRMPEAEYGVFVALLSTFTLMGVPVIGLQTTFTQQAAVALHDDHQRELAGILRGVFRAVFVIWLVAAGLVFLLRNPILAHFKIANPTALWLTVVIGFVSMWLPVEMGLLQGRQDFLWLGWAQMLNGAGRFVAVCLIVLVLGGYAAGALGGVLAGMLVALLLCAWHNRHYWRLDPKPVAWAQWWRQVIPLTFGLGTSTFMLTADMVFVQGFFSKEQTGFYGAAGMIGRALVYFTQPLTTVMFPKLARSAARQQKSDVLAQALGVTALAGGAAAIGCTLFPSLPLRIVYSKSYLPVAAPLVPWFAWCMLPLTLANVLISALLARRQFAAVPWLALVAAGYAVTLYFRHATFKMVIQTLGLYGLLLLAVSAWFAWVRKPAPAAASSSPSAP